MPCWLFSYICHVLYNGGILKPKCWHVIRLYWLKTIQFLTVRPTRVFWHKICATFVPNICFFCQLTFVETLRLTPGGNKETPVLLSCMLVDCGRKIEHLEETHTDIRRAQLLIFNIWTSSVEWFVVIQWDKWSNRWPGFMTWISF